jgi:hypothetical protein
MPNLTLSVPHQLTRAEAKRRMQEGLTRFQQQYGGLVGQVEHRWDGDTLDFQVSAAGQTVSGQATVDDHQVHLIVALPWMLAMLAGPIKKQLEQQGRHLLAPH